MHQSQVFLVRFFSFEARMGNLTQIHAGKRGTGDNLKRWESSVNPACSYSSPGGSEVIVARLGTASWKQPPRQSSKTC